MNKLLICLLLINALSYFTYACSNIPKPNIEYIYDGHATSFGGTLHSGFCGFKEQSFTKLYSKKMGIALNAPQWNNSLNCGRCVQIQYKNNPPIMALISDQCPECKHGDLDLFEESYKELIKDNPGREKIKWNFINCDQFVEGNIKLRIDYINKYWLSLNPENFLCGINNIEIMFDSEWIQLDRNDNTMSGLYFNYHGYVKTPFKLKLTSMYNEQLITQLYYQEEHILQTNFQFSC